MGNAVTILDYGAGNLTSVRLAFARLGADAAVITDASQAGPEGAIVFPGVGSAGSGMAALRRRGFDRLLREALLARRPVLGICLGMQLLFNRSEEDGGQEALGLIDGECRLFRFDGASRHLKVPEIGWNAVCYPAGLPVHPCFDGIADGTAFYFVHSYYATASHPEETAGITEYGDCRFVAAARSGSLFATQFHPERSGEAGLRLLDNFLKWRAAPSC